MNEFCLSAVLKEKLYKAEQELGDRDSLIEIDTHMLDAWEYRDDVEVDFAAVSSLAKSIAEKGQAQPIVITRVNDTFQARTNKHVQYVVIAGFRRFLACKKLDRPVQAVVRNYNFEEAIACLISENEKQHVSDFSLGLVCHNLLESNKISEEELCKQVSVSKEELNQLLCFSQVPLSFWSNTANVHHISRKAADIIHKYWRKGEIYQRALSQVAPQIGKTKSFKSWQTALLKIIHGEEEKHKEKPFELLDNGKKLMTVNKNGQIRFYSSIAKNERFDSLRDQIAELALNFYKQSSKKK
jgi:ParB/RepB/Spo0J family partition protein